MNGSYKRNWTVAHAFNRYPAVPPAKEDTGECKHCKDSTDPRSPPYKKAWNAKRFQDHLDQCLFYLKWKEREAGEQPSASGSTQQKLAIRKPDHTATKDRLDQLFSIAVYTSVASFRMFESSE